MSCSGPDRALTVRADRNGWPTVVFVCLTTRRNDQRLAKRLEMDYTICAFNSSFLVIRNNISGTDRQDEAEKCAHYHLLLSLRVIGFAMENTWMILDDHEL
jgi:hypothetical protein